MHRVTVALLLVLDGETHAVGEPAHLFGFAEECRLFFKAPEILTIRSVQVPAHEFVFAGLDDDANLLDAGGVEFEEVVMKQGARNAVRADDREEFLFHGMGRREVPRAQPGNGDDGFANGAVHTVDRFQPAAPKL